MLQKLTCMMALCSALWLPAAAALGLGDMEVKSQLNQKFLGKIAVVTESLEESEALQVNLASNEEFERAGIERSEFVGSLKFELKAQDKGALIEVTSAQIAREPYISFLLDVRTGKGRLLREYTVLLDPPYAAEKAAVSAPIGKTAQFYESAGETAAKPAPAPAPVKPAAAAAVPSATVVSGDGTYGPVRPQETLWSIATKLRASPSVTMDQVLLSLYKGNPGAFTRGINGLNQGAMLRVPTEDEQRAVPAASAKAQVAELRGLPPPAPRPKAAAKPVQVAEAPSEPPPAPPAPPPPQAQKPVVPPTPAPTPAVSSVKKPVEPEKPAPVAAVPVPPPTGPESQPAVPAPTPAPAPPTPVATEAPAAANANTDAPATTVSAIPAEEVPPTPTESAGSIETVPTPEAGASTPPVPVTAPAPGPLADVPAEADAGLGLPLMEIALLALVLVGGGAGYWFYKKKKAAAGDEPPARASKEPKAKGPGLGEQLQQLMAKLRPKKAEEPRAAAMTAAESAAIPDLEIPVEDVAVPSPRAAPAPKPKPAMSQPDVEPTMRMPAPAVKAPAAVALDSTLAMTVKSPAQGTPINPDATQIMEAPEAGTMKISEKVDFDVTGQFESETVSINLDTNDPIAEADFHLAYGLYDEAALLLIQASEKEPENSALKVKLAEVYFAASKSKEFLELAQNIQGQIPAEEWQKLAIFGQQLCPDAAIFQGAAGDLGGGAVDLSFDEPAAPAPGPAAAPAPSTPGGSVLDFKIEDFDLPAAGPAPAPAAAPAADLNTLNFSLEIPEIKADLPETPKLELDLAEFNLDTPAPATKPAAADGELSLEDFDLSTDSTSLSVGENAGDKLDLARFYVEQGDKDTARGLLDEVVVAGNAAQQQEAKAMLARL